MSPSSIGDVPAADCALDGKDTAATKTACSHDDILSRFPARANSSFARIAEDGKLDPRKL